MIKKQTLLAKYISKLGRLLLVLVLLVVSANLEIKTTEAASITTFSDTMSRLKASTLSNHDIRFVTPTGVDASTDTITLTFSAGFTMGTFALLNFDLNVSASSSCTSFGTAKTLATSAAAGVWGIGQSGQVVTLTAPTNATTGEITAGRCVQVLIGSGASTGGAGAIQITNGSIGSSDTVAIAGVFGDTGTAAVEIISNDQITVSATVDPTITFTLIDASSADNAIGFGSLSSASAKYANAASTGSGSDVTAVNMTVATNATTGYVLSYSGDTLKSGSDSIAVATITADADGTPGTAQFATGYTASGGSTVVTAYANGSNNWSYVANTTTTIVSRTTPTNTETIAGHYLANIGGSTPAGSYSTTITYIATGTF